MLKNAPHAKLNFLKDLQYNFGGSEIRTLFIFVMFDECQDIFQ